jgi:hypothetical protein
MSNQAIVGENDDLIAKGDYVLFRFDKETRARDKDAAGYCLELHVARVLQVLTSESVKVQWMFAKSWRDQWYEWRKPKTNEAYTDEMPSALVLQDSHGVAAKMTFRRESGGRKTRARIYLDAKSLSVVNEILEQDEFSSVE